MIRRATPGITWPTPAPIAFGQALSNLQSNASLIPATTTTTPTGHFDYSFDVGTKPDVGDNQPLTVTFTPDDTKNFASSTSPVYLSVRKAQPIFTGLSASTSFVYGSQSTLAVSGQIAAKYALLDAGAPIAITIGSRTKSTSVAADGTLATILDVSGLSASALPYTIDYHHAGGQRFEVADDTRALTINRATPSVSWSAPDPIVFGTPFSPDQLNATHSVAGHFAYAPGAGAILDAGSQAISATFMPDDSVNYQPVAAGVSLSVLQATPSLSGLSSPPAIVAGQASLLLSGHLTAPTAVPSDQAVSISVGGVSGMATVGADGSFSTTLNVAGLAASGSPYAITYAFAGSANFAATSDASTSLAVSVPVPSPSAPPTASVVLQSGRAVISKKTVSSVVLTFSGALDPTSAGTAGDYRLVMAGKKGSFVDKTAKPIAVSSAKYDPVAHSVTLTPSKPFLASKAVQVRAFGSAGQGVLDSFNRPIDGNHDGSAGGDAVATVSKKQVAIRGVGQADHVEILWAEAVDQVIPDLDLPGRRRRGRGRS